MSDTAIIGQTSEKFLFLEHKNVIPKTKDFVKKNLRKCYYKA